MDDTAHSRQVQSKGQLHFLAFLGEKRLAQEQDHKQETERKQNLAGYVKSAHLQRLFQRRYLRSGEMKSHGDQKTATEITEPFGGEGDLRETPGIIGGDIGDGS